jgi:hypothetical protein
MQDIKGCILTSSKIVDDSSVLDMLMSLSFSITQKLSHPLLELKGVSSHLGHALPHMGVEQRIYSFSLLCPYFCSSLGRS